MDAISAHPNVGPFIGAQLIQRLVASNPSPAYGARVAAVFADDGLGARQPEAVTRAVLLDPEARFRSLASPHWGKVREPILRFPAGRGPSARARATAPGPCPTPATTPSGWRKADARAQRVQLLPAALHARRHRAGAPGLAAPELQITDETSIAGYLNFLAIYADRGWEDLQTDYAAELALAGDPDALVAHVALLLAGDAFSEATARRIATALRDIPPERPRDRARAAIVLVAASPGIPGAEMTATRHADAGRRAFLLRACALAAGAAAPLAANLAALGAAAAHEAPAGSYKALVCVFLYGGNDPYNHHRAV